MLSFSIMGSTFRTRCKIICGCKLGVIVMYVQITYMGELLAAIEAIILLIGLVNMLNCTHHAVLMIKSSSKK
ncbi:hypothetical protein IAD21_01334 [Abditibacteriota bacterium]|nr:hypothetical protein IAD21_01334 [Abditibacteriota bacterium]